MIFQRIHTCRRSVSHPSFTASPERYSPPASGVIAAIAGGGFAVTAESLF